MKILVVCCLLVASTLASDSECTYDGYDAYQSHYSLCPAYKPMHRYPGYGGGYWFLKYATCLSEGEECGLSNNQYPCSCIGVQVVIDSDQCNCSFTDYQTGTTWAYNKTSGKVLTWKNSLTPADRCSFCSPLIFQIKNSTTGNSESEAAKLLFTDCYQTCTAFVMCESGNVFIHVRKDKEISQENLKRISDIMAVNGLCFDDLCQLEVEGCQVPDCLYDNNGCDDSDCGSDDDGSNGSDCESDDDSDDSDSDDDDSDASDCDSDDDSDDSDCDSDDSDSDDSDSDSDDDSDDCDSDSDDNDSDDSDSDSDDDENCE